LDEAVEVTGSIAVNLWVSSTAVDTDFTAKLLDVYPPSEDFPDGYHLNLTDSIIRARYRNGFEREELMEPGQVCEVRMVLQPTSNLFAPGHRMRIDIASSSFPKFDVNPNTGEPLGRHTRTVKAANTVYLDSGQPSHVVLPIVPSR
jgi:putative CocE/NonD family hydrolase